MDARNDNNKTITNHLTPTIDVEIGLAFYRTAIHTRSQESRESRERERRRRLKRVNKRGKSKLQGRKWKASHTELVERFLPDVFVFVHNCPPACVGRWIGGAVNTCKKRNKRGK